MPLTHWQERYAIKIEPSTTNGLLNTFCADTFQVRSVAQQRFVKKLGDLSTEEMNCITKALAIVLVI